MCTSRASLTTIVPPLGRMLLACSLAAGAFGLRAQTPCEPQLARGVTEVVAYDGRDGVLGLISDVDAQAAIDCLDGDPAPEWFLDYRYNPPAEQYMLPGAADLVFSPGIPHEFRRSVNLPLASYGRVALHGNGAVIRLRPVGPVPILAGFQHVVPSGGTNGDAEFLATSASGWSIENLTFVGPGPGSPARFVKGLDLQGMSRVTIRGCRFVDLTIGVEMRFSLLGVVESCRFENNSLHDVALLNRAREPGDPDCYGRRALDGPSGDEALNCWLPVAALSWWETTCSRSPGCEGCFDPSGACVIDGCPMACRELQCPSPAEEITSLDPPEVRCELSNPAGNRIFAPGPAWVTYSGSNGSIVRHSMHVPGSASTSAVSLHVRSGDRLLMDHAMFSSLDHRPKNAVRWRPPSALSHLILRDTSFDLPGIDACTTSQGLLATWADQSLTGRLVVDGLTVRPRPDAGWEELLYLAEDTSAVLHLLDAPALPRNVRMRTSGSTTLVSPEFLFVHVGGDDSVRSPTAGPLNPVRWCGTRPIATAVDATRLALASPARVDALYPALRDGCADAVPHQGLAQQGALTHVGSGPNAGLWFGGTADGQDADGCDEIFRLTPD